VPPSGRQRSLSRYNSAYQGQQGVVGLRLLDPLAVRAEAQMDCYGDRLGLRESILVERPQLIIRVSQTLGRHTVSFRGAQSHFPLYT
jgi:hypothetical protein